MPDTGIDALPTTADVVAAAALLEGRLRRTPVLKDAEFDALVGARLFFKCENLQIGGAFKARGATHAVLRLRPGEAARGVATHSSGNHGAALARAARVRGIPCHVVVPEGAMQLKVGAIARHGAHVHRCAATQAAREAGLAAIIAATGAVAIPPYDDARIIAGQGTAALELLERVPDLDMLIMPAGGGGLLAGSALAARHVAAPPEVIGVEPAGAADMALSLANGARTAVTPDTIADGLRATVGILNFELIRRHVTAIWTVDDAAILAAMREVWQRLRLLIEPSAAVVVAAALARPDLLRGRRVGLILSGGNVDPRSFQLD